MGVPLSHRLRASNRNLRSTFCLIIFIGALNLSIRVRLNYVARALRGVGRRFNKRLPCLLPTRLHVPRRPKATTGVRHRAARAVVRKRAVAMTFRATFVSRDLHRTLTRNRHNVFCHIVFIRLRITLHAGMRVRSTILTGLFRRIIRRTRSNTSITASIAIRVRARFCVHFLNNTACLYPTLANRSSFNGLIPAIRVASTKVVR